MNKKYLLILMLVIGFTLGYILLIDESNREPKIKDRWYSQSQVDRGKIVFQNNCAVCHGGSAQGSLNWNKRLSDGSFPPPPLNGNAHTWHHSLTMLKDTIKRGSINRGGKMPAFGDKLSNDEMESVIAFFQSKWNSKIYSTWKNKVNK